MHNPDSKLIHFSIIEIIVYCKVKRNVIAFNYCKLFSWKYVLLVLVVTQWFPSFRLKIYLLQISHFYSMHHHVLLFNVKPCLYKSYVLWKDGTCNHKRVGVFFKSFISETKFSSLNKCLATEKCGKKINEMDFRAKSLNTCTSKKKAATNQQSKGLITWAGLGFKISIKITVSCADWMLLFLNNSNQRLRESMSKRLSQIRLA